MVTGELAFAIMPALVLTAPAATHMRIFLEYGRNRVVLAAVRGTTMRASIRPTILSLFVVVLAVAASPVSAQTVTMCGQTVTGSGALAADLDCTGYDGAAVTVHGGTLAMSRHSITGGVTGIQCDRPCQIVGPGQVIGSEVFGVNGVETSVHVRQVDVTGNALGIQCFKRCLLEGPATVSGNTQAIRGGNLVKLIDMTVSANQSGIEATSATGRGGDVVLINSTVSDNVYTGVTAQRRIKAIDSTITGNGEFGVSAGASCVRRGSVSLTGTTVTGNDTYAGCGSTTVCADVITCGGLPKIRSGSVCDHSYLNGSGNPGETLHVCTAD
jgi:hypothetical protein